MRRIVATEYVNLDGIFEEPGDSSVQNGSDEPAHDANPSCAIRLPPFASERLERST